MALATHEKSLNYAKEQLEEGELMNAKFLLDQTVTNIQKVHFEDCSPEVQESLQNLEAKIDDLKSGIVEYKRRSRKASMNTV